MLEYIRSKYQIMFYSFLVGRTGTKVIDPDFGIPKDASGDFSIATEIKNILEFVEFRVDIQKINMVPDARNVIARQPVRERSDVRSIRGLDAKPYPIVFIAAIVGIEPRCLRISQTTLKKGEIARVAIAYLGFILAELAVF